MGSEPFSLVMVLIAACCYFANGVQISYRIYHRSLPNRTLTLALAAVALLVHLAYLVSVIPVGAYQDLSILNIAALAAWVISLLLTLLYLKKPLQALLPMAFFATALVLLLELLLPNHHFAQLQLRPAVLIHVSLSILAYSLLCITALLALLLSYLSKHLKAKRPEALNPAMPPLLSVERQLYQLMLIGTLALASAQIAGFFFLEHFFNQGKAHKVVLSLCALLIYVSMLWRHRVAGLKSRWLVSGSICGACLLTLAYFGSRIVREVLLGST